MKKMYNREEDLKNVFNNTIQNILKLPQDDYYTKLSHEQILTLKSTLNCINNIITLRMTLLLCEWICERFKNANHNKIIKSIMACKPNANGYDIQLDTPDIIAEVKCNIPTNRGKKYGSKQKEGITKDIRGLLEGKTKSKKKIENSFKFLGLYDTANVREATTHLVTILSEDLRDKIVIDPEHNTNWKTDIVYVIYLK